MNGFVPLAAAREDGDGDVRWAVKSGEALYAGARVRGAAAEAFGAAVWAPRADDDGCDCACDCDCCDCDCCVEGVAGEDACWC